MILAHDDSGGSGPVVVLLHSTVADRRMWAGLTEVLTDAGYRTIAPDFRGHGQSPLPQATPGGPGPGSGRAAPAYADADDVLDLLVELGVDSCHVVGSSFGGRVAAQLVAAAPDGVSSLCLLAPALLEGEPTQALREFWEAETRLLEAGLLDVAADLNVATWLGPEADEAARSLLRTMQRRAFEVQLAAGDVAVADRPIPQRVEVPVLVVTGGLDLPDFVTGPRRWAARVGARCLQLLWAGHLPVLERPEETAALVLGHLRGAERTQTDPELARDHL